MIDFVVFGCCWWFLFRWSLQFGVVLICVVSAFVVLTCINW